MKRLLLLLLLVPAVASGAELRVDASGGGDHQTIDAALTAASDGDTLLIAPGTYTGDLVFDDGREITLRGDTAADVILQGTGAGPVITVGSGGSGLTLERLTVTGGATVGDGGCIAVTNASPAFTDVIAHSCTAANGGCVALEQSLSVLTNVVQHDCHAINPGTELWEGGSGGALFTRESSPDIVGLRAFGNIADSHGGAVMLDDSPFPRIEASWLHDNLAAVASGLMAESGTDATLIDVTISDNVQCFGGGGLMALHGAELTVTGATIVRNSVDHDGLCASSIDGNGGGIQINEATLSLVASQVSWNDAGGAMGGGMVAYNDPSDVVIERSIFEANFASVGGGLALHQDLDTALIDRCRISGNEANDSAGGAVLEVPDGRVQGTLFDGNRANNWAGDLAIEATAADPGVVVRNTVFYDGRATQGGSLVLQGLNSEVKSSTIFDARTNSNDSGAVHVVEVAGQGVTTALASVVVAESDGAWDLWADPADGTLDVSVEWSLLAGGSAGTFGGELTTLAPLETILGAPVFENEDINGDWDTLLRLSAGSLGQDDGDAALGPDPDTSDPDRGAFGGGGASIWDDGDEDGDGVTVWEGDCHDDDPAVHPGADEDCNCRDDNCDGFIDVDCSATGFCYEPTAGGDDDSTGDDDDSTGDDDDSTGDDDDSTGDDDDDDSGGPVPFDPAAGCLVRCDAAGAGAPSALLVLVGLALRRRRVGSGHV